MNNAAKSKAWPSLLIINLCYSVQDQHEVNNQCHKRANALKPFWCMSKGKPLIDQKDRTRMLHQVRNGLFPPFLLMVLFGDFRKLVSKRSLLSGFREEYSVGMKRLAVILFLSMPLARRESRS